MAFRRAALAAAAAAARGLAPAAARAAVSGPAAAGGAKAAGGLLQAASAGAARRAFAAQAAPAAAAAAGKGKVTQVWGMESEAGWKGGVIGVAWRQKGERGRIAPRATALVSLRSPSLCTCVCEIGPESGPWRPVWPSQDVWSAPGRGGRAERPGLAPGRALHGGRAAA